MQASAALTSASWLACSRSKVRQCIPFGFQPLPLRMPSGDIDQEEIARALHQSPSTLQRRLREEGTSYQQLLDTTRHELAIDYLREGQHSLADITFLLGFSDQSNFTRAFRRWTGRTPREYLS